MTTASESLRDDVVTVRWVCLRWVSKKRGGVYVYEQCGHTGVTTPTRAEYDAREARARCPSCGGMLTQRSDGCEVASDV